MFEWSPRERLLYGTRLAAVLGAVAGGVEAMGQGVVLRLPLSLGEGLLLGAAAVGMLGALGAVFGLLCGLLVQAVARGASAPVAGAVQLGLVGTLLCGWFVWPASAEVWGQGRTVGAVVIGVLPLMFYGVVYFNARYWLRRFEIGAVPAVGFTQVALGAAALLVIGGGLAHALRDTGGWAALEGDRNVVLITVDGLRHDHLGEAMAGLGEQGVTYLDVVTPTPASAPAHGTLFTGFRPLRHGLLLPGSSLSRQHRHLARVLEREGYATAAFVSNEALGAPSGLDHGFRVYDDAIGQGPGAIGRVTVAARLRALLRRGPPATRQASHTTARFMQWFQRHSEVPFLAWVHFAEPATGAPEDYAAQVQAVDEQVRAVLAALDEAGVAGRTIVVLTAPHGRMLGEHGLQGHEGLYDPLVRVPLVVRAPGLEATVPRVQPQVRLMDVPATILHWLQIDGLGETEGAELLGYATGRRSRPMWTSLVGVQGDTVLFGLRHDGWKYIRDLDSEQERLFDLANDPGEEQDVSGSLDEDVERIRGLLQPEAVALRGLLGR